MMTDLRKAAQQALEALDCIYSPLHVREINKVGAAIATLQTALAQPAQADPWPAVEQINLARADAELLGTGFTVDGLRVSPERVVMIKQNAIAPLAQPDVPEGYVLVPVEPTEEMINALGNSWTGVNIATWQRLIAAAPKGGEA